MDKIKNDRVSKSVKVLENKILFPSFNEEWLDTPRKVNIEQIIKQGISSSIPPKKKQKDMVFTTRFLLASEVPLSWKKQYRPVDRRSKNLNKHPSKRKNLESLINSDLSKIENEEMTEKQLEQKLKTDSSTPSIIQNAVQLRIPPTKIRSILQPSKAQQKFDWVFLNNYVIRESKVRSRIRDDYSGEIYCPLTRRHFESERIFFESLKANKLKEIRAKKQINFQDYVRKLAQKRISKLPTRISSQVDLTKMPLTSRSPSPPSKYSRKETAGKTRPKILRIGSFHGEINLQDSIYELAQEQRDVEEAPTLSYYGRRMVDTMHHASSVITGLKNIKSKIKDRLMLIRSSSKSKFNPAIRTMKIAVKQDSLKEFRGILDEHPELISYEFNIGSSWLHFSCLFGAFNISNYLMMEKGLNPLSKDHFGRSSLEVLEGSNFVERFQKDRISERLMATITISNKSEL